jgi:hypothetical protein
MRTSVKAVLGLAAATAAAVTSGAKSDANAFSLMGHGMATPPSNIELVQGRGGPAHCLDCARAGEFMQDQGYQVEDGGGYAERRYYFRDNSGEFAYPDGRYRWPGPTQSPYGDHVVVQSYNGDRYGNVPDREYDTMGRYVKDGYHVYARDYNRPPPAGELGHYYGGPGHPPSRGEFNLSIVRQNLMREGLPPKGRPGYMGRVPRFGPMSGD